MNEHDKQLHKIDVRAAIFKNGKILLTKQGNNRWALPGGVCNTAESISQNIKKMVSEQTGMDVSVKSVISIQTLPPFNSYNAQEGLCKILLLCTISDNTNAPLCEISSFFGFAAFPSLATEYTSEDQLYLCFDALRAQNAAPHID